MRTVGRNIRMVALLLCVMLTVSGCTLFKSGKYEKGVELFEQEQYLEAQKWFLKIEEYEDAQQYLDYILAWNVSMNREYGRAAEMYAALGDFCDSAQQAVACSYAYAQQLLAEGQYDEAIVAFTAAGTYQDAPERIRETYYAKAEALAAQGSLEEAIEVFALIVDCPGVTERIRELHYAAALQKLANGEYESACAHFEASDGYQDSAQYLEAEKLFAADENNAAVKAYQPMKDVPGVSLRIQMIQYDYAEKVYEKKLYERAAQLFRQIDDYADAHERAGKLYYDQGVKAKDKDDMKEAKRLFELAGDYGDAALQLKMIHYQLAAELLAQADFYGAAVSYVKAGDYQDAFQQAVNIKRLLVTKGKPIVFDFRNELANQQQASVRQVWVKYIEETDKYRVTIELTVPKGYPVWVFNPPNGNRFMRRAGTTTGEPQELVFELEAEKLEGIATVTINCVKSDRNRFFIFLQTKDFR